MERKRTPARFGSAPEPVRFRHRYLALSLLLLGAVPSPAMAGGAALELCLAAAADRSPVYPTRTFPAGATREVVAVFRLGEGESFGTFTARWTAVDVGEAAPPNYVIATSELALRGQDRGTLRLHGLQQPMPAGTYRLDVLADGKSWRSAEFGVADMPPPPVVKRPEDLLPLSEGTVWKYAFVQEAGAGARITLPGVEPDADGRYRAVVTLTATKADAAGVRVESRRNGVVVFEEWWRVGGAGWSATQRKTPEATVRLDPPQLFVPFPLRAHQWRYEPKDRSYRQSYRMWGPLPVRTPQGVAPGYVVLVEQANGLVTITTERHFLPGVGMVREIIVQALGGRMVSRQELVLEGAR